MRRLAPFSSTSSGSYCTSPRCRSTAFFGVPMSTKAAFHPRQHVLDLGPGRRLPVDLAHVVGGAATRSARSGRGPSSTAIWVMRPCSTKPSVGGVHVGTHIRLAADRGRPLALTPPGAARARRSSELERLAVDQPSPGSAPVTDDDRRGPWTVPAAAHHRFPAATATLAATRRTALLLGWLAAAVAESGPWPASAARGRAGCRRSVDAARAARSAGLDRLRPAFRRSIGQLRRGRRSSSSPVWVRSCSVDPPIGARRPGAVFVHRREPRAARSSAPSLGSAPLVLVLVRPRWGLRRGCPR